MIPLVTNPNSEFGSKPRRFAPVHSSAPMGGETKRDPEGGTLWTSGRLLLNTGATDDWRELCTKAGLEAGKAVAHLQVDGDNMVVAARPVIATREATGLAPTRLINDGANIVIPLGGAFKENPSLRPTGRRQVVITVEPDDDGNNCLMVALQSALPKPVISRKSTSSSDSKSSTTNSSVEKSSAKTSSNDQSSATKQS